MLLVQIEFPLLLPCQLGGVEVLERGARQVSALQLPDSHVLVSASHELVAVVWIELDAKDRQVAQVTKGQRPVLFPLEYLDGERAIHAD